MKQLFVVLCALLSLVSCRRAERTYPIIPYPNSVEARGGDFDLRDAAVVCDPAFEPQAQAVVEIFAHRLEHRIGDRKTGASNPVEFRFDASLAPEAYTLEIGRGRIDIAASSLNGVLYAIQSLQQLMPVEFFGDARDSRQGGEQGDEPNGEQSGGPNSDRAQARWTVPCVKIADAPRFGYRGMHLDVARHFFEVDEVKRYLDIMAFHKLNTLHWHLTDDQGWRVEIKRYPELTLVGGFRDQTVVGKDWDRYDGVRYGGYYTQEQIREVVAYASSIGIRVIPEIDLPGHMLAALTAYPELGCTGGPYKVWGRWGVSDEVLCAGNERTYEFIENVLAEVIELFPSQYIHIGGDECPKTRWEACPKCQQKIRELGLKDTEKFTAEHYLQSYVMSRAEAFLAEHGRRIIGWDEILEGEVSPTATIMSWRSADAAVEAARMGRDAILVPTSHCYFDYYQSAETQAEPFGIGGYVPIERVYAFDASLGGALTAGQTNRILGVQANLWTEYIATPEHLEYMLLPRLAALSEVQWCNDEVKQWPRFVQSLERICAIYDRMGYNYATTVFGITASRRVVPERSCVELTLATSGDAPIHYTLDGTDPTTASPRYTAPIEIDRGCTVKAIAAREGIPTRMYVKEFVDSKSLGAPATLNSEPHERYGFTGASLLTDGVYGLPSYSNGEWLGYQGPLDVTIAMGDKVPYSSVSCNMLLELGDDIFPPASITVYTAQDPGQDGGRDAGADGGPFTQVATMQIPTAAQTDDTNSRVENYTVAFAPTDAPFVRVVVQPARQIPAWHPAHGRKPFIFVDEIAVN